MNRATYLLLMVCVIGGCSFEAHCGGGKTVQADSAEASIKATYTGKGLDVTAVHCDTSKAEPVAGKTFSCKLDIGTFTYVVNATITSCTDDNCKFDLALGDGPHVIGKLVTDEVTKFLQGKVSNPQVDCKEPIPAVGADNTVHCAVVSDEFHGDAIVGFQADHATIDSIELDSINGDAMAGQLAKTIADQHHVTAQVDCGHWVKRTADGVYHCKVTGVEGVTQLEVTTHPDGSFDWKGLP